MAQRGERGRGRSVGAGATRSGTLSGRGQAAQPAGRTAASAATGSSSSSIAPRRDIFALLRSSMQRDRQPIRETQVEAVVELMTQQSSTQSSSMAESSSSLSQVAHLHLPGATEAGSRNPPLPACSSSPIPQVESEGLFPTAGGESIDEAWDAAEALGGEKGWQPLLTQSLLEECEVEEDVEDLTPDFSPPSVRSPSAAAAAAAGWDSPIPPATRSHSQDTQEKEGQVEEASEQPHAPASEVLGSDEGESDHGDPSYSPTHSPSSEEAEGQGRSGRSQRGGESSARGSSVRGRGSRQPRSQQRAAGTASSQSRAGGVTTPGSKKGVFTSPIWQFFTLASEDGSKVRCNLCHAPVSRGKPGTRLGTGGLHTHMKNNHKRQLLLSKGLGEEEEDASSSSSSRPRKGSAAKDKRPPPASSTVPGPPVSGVPTASSTSAPPPPPSSAYQRQPLIVESFPGTRVLPQTHHRVRRLNGMLTRAMTQHLLPYSIVEEGGAFRELLEFGIPEWRIPSRHFFARRAVPALHEAMVCRLNTSLDHSVGGRVHLTMDSWTSKFGQGRYLSFTAHWVTLQSAVEGSGPSATPELVAPPRGLKGRRAAAPSATASASASATASAAPAAEPPSKRPHRYNVEHRRCQAVLRLVSLGEERHTGPNVLAALQEQEKQWLTCRGLRVGQVVCDNGSNLLAALRVGNLSHVPCFAHVLNLIVQRFLRTYQDLSGVVEAARRLVAHFRRSPTSTSSLFAVQRRLGLTPHRLVADCPTRWNSTLHMLETLCEHRRAVMECLVFQGIQAPTSQLPTLSGQQWGQIQQVCRVLTPFDQATKLVCRDNVSLSDVIPLVFLLDRALGELMDLGEAALEQAEAQRQLHAETQAQGQAESQEEEAEEVLEALEPVDEGEVATLVRGWEEPQQQHREEEQDLQVLESGYDDEEDMPDNAGMFPMAAHMLRCLRRDPRIVNMKDNEDLWVATLLDPRLKGKMGEFIGSTMLDRRMRELQQALVRRLQQAFPQRTPPALPRRQAQPAPSTSSGGSTTSRMGDLLGLKRALYQPVRPREEAAATSSQQQRLAHMVEDYMGSLSACDTMRTEDPMEYWAARLDTCSELAQYALEVLSCPPSSVLSERTFSAAGGVVTDKRTRLSTQSVDKLTFIKMNEAWVPTDFQAPIVGSRT